MADQVDSLRGILASVADEYLIAKDELKKASDALGFHDRAFRTALANYYRELTGRPLPIKGQSKTER